MIMELPDTAVMMASECSLTVIFAANTLSFTAHNAKKKTTRKIIGWFSQELARSEQVQVFSCGKHKNYNNSA